MENENIITLQLQLTRRKALFLLTAFFLAWHPRFLGSETLTLTTYYPAPYGGYASLLTTGQTLLARDGVVTAGTLTTGSFVRLGTGYNATNGRRDTNVRLEVDNDISVTNNVKWGTARASLSAINVATDAGGSIELGGAGTFGPHVDFSQTMAQNYSARLWLSEASRLQVIGDFEVTGQIWNACTRVAYSVGGAAACPANSVVAGYLGDNSAAGVSGFLPASAEAWNGVGTYIHLGENWSGTMICCKFRPI